MPTPRPAVGGLRCSLARRSADTGRVAPGRGPLADRRLAGLVAVVRRATWRRRAGLDIAAPACPSDPAVTSNRTFWPSLSVLNPCMLIAEKCANRSSPPPSGVMKPNPFASLNHLTVPVAIRVFLPDFERCRRRCRRLRAGRRKCKYCASGTGAPAGRRTPNDALLRAASRSVKRPVHPAFPLKKLLQSSNIEPQLGVSRRDDGQPGAARQRARGREDASQAAAAVQGACC